MPRRSHRRETIEQMHLRVSLLHQDLIAREVLDEEDSEEDDKYILNHSILQKMIRSRYMFRKTTYRKNRKKFDIDDALSFNSLNYNDEEFLSYFRISRESFFLLLDQIKTQKAFVQNPKKKKQRSVAFQLLVYLYRVGQEGVGGGCGPVGGFFGIAKGSIKNYVRRCVLALLQMKDDVVYWPDKRERKEMRNRLSVKGFRHCVGIIDGTLVQLAFRPEAYHECYYSRKCMYALNVN